MAHLDDVMDDFLESHADSSVAAGARRLVSEGRARWERTSRGAMLLSVPNDAWVLITVVQADFGTTDHFWAELER